MALLAMPRSPEAPRERASHGGIDLSSRDRSATGDADPSQANQLANLVRDCVVAGIGRQALLLRLSGLPQTLRRPQHLRLARAAIEPLVRADRARLFTLAGDDLAVVWRGAAASALESATGALARLFEDEQALSIGTPWRVFALPAEAESLLAAIHPPPLPAPPPSTPPPDKLDIRALGLLEAGLANVDVARFVRRRRVCALGHDGSFLLRWEQRFLSITELTDTLTPDRAIRADKWLYRRLTRTLDQRMLALLAAPQELRDAGPFSVGLNIAGILSSAFLRFDAALPSHLRGQIVLELLPADILGDLAAFMFARDFARERGYRLLLREMNADLLPVFPLTRTGVDLMELRWSDALGAAGGGAVVEGPSCVVLARTDTPQALAWGRAHGIGYFQGRLAEPV